MPIIYSNNTEFQAYFESQKSHVLTSVNFLANKDEPIQYTYTLEDFEFLSIPLYATNIAKMKASTFFVNLKQKGMHVLGYNRDRSLIASAQFYVRYKDLHHKEWTNGWIGINHDSQNYDLMFALPEFMDASKIWEIRQISFPFLYIDIVWFHDQNDPTNKNDVCIRLKRSNSSDEEVVYTSDTIPHLIDYLKKSIQMRCDPTPPYACKRCGMIEFAEIKKRRDRKRICPKCGLFIRCIPRPG